MVHQCDWLDGYNRVCEQEFETTDAYLDHLAEHYRQQPPSQEGVPC